MESHLRENASIEGMRKGERYERMRTVKGDRQELFPLLSLAAFFDTLARFQWRPQHPLSGLSYNLFNLTHRKRTENAPRKTKNTRKQSETTRRSTLAAGAAIASALASALLPASPAQAFLGFGGASKDDVYATDTVRMSELVERMRERKREKTKEEEVTAVSRLVRPYLLLNLSFFSPFSPPPSSSNFLVRRHRHRPRRHRPRPRRPGPRGRRRRRAPGDQLVGRQVPP